MYHSPIYISPDTEENRVDAIEALCYEVDKYEFNCYPKRAKEPEYHMIVYDNIHEMLDVNNIIMVGEKELMHVSYRYMSRGGFTKQRHALINITKASWKYLSSMECFCCSNISCDCSAAF